MSAATPERNAAVELPPSNGGQPLLSAGFIGALAVAVIGLLAAFGLPITDVQERAILLLVGVLAPLVVALAARGKVTPNLAVTAYRTVVGQVVAGAASSSQPGTPVQVSRAADLGAVFPGELARGGHIATGRHLHFNAGGITVDEHLRRRRAAQGEGVDVVGGEQVLRPGEGVAVRDRSETGPHFTPEGDGVADYEPFPPEQADGLDELLRRSGDGTTT